MSSVLRYNYIKCKLVNCFAYLAHKVKLFRCSISLSVHVKLRLNYFSSTKYYCKNVLQNLYNLAEFIS